MPRVRKRDGRVVDYDESKVAHEILMATQASGEADPALAYELAEVVTFFLDKHHGTGNGDTLVEPDSIVDMIERVLLETAPPGVAKAFMLRRQRREQAGDDITVHRAASYGQKNLFPDDTLTVEAEGRAEAMHWDRARMIDALTRECDLAPRVAAEIAERVEERVFTSGLRRVTTSLIRELIDVELFTLGLNQQRSRQAVLGVPKFDLEAAIFRGRAGDAGSGFRGPADLDRFVHHNILGRFTLQEIHSEPVASAHLDGQLHLHGLGAPLRLHALRVCPEGIKHGWPQVPRVPGAVPPDARAGADRIAAPATEEQFLALLRRYAEECLELVTDTVTFGNLSLVLAPLAARMDEPGRRSLLRRTIGALSGRPASRLVLEFPLDVPAPLRDARAAGLGGAVAEGTTMGDLAGVVRDLAREAVLLLREGTHQALLAPDVVIVLDGDAPGLAGAAEVLELAADCAARHGAPRFRFPRPARLTPGADYRERFGPDALLHDKEVAIVSVALNLAQAAFRAGRGSHDAFAGECDALLALAQKGIAERHQMLVSALARLHHPLLAVGRDGTLPRHPASIDLASGFARLELVGLSEALTWLAEPGEASTGSLFGDEPGTSGESAARGGLRAVSYLSFALREQEAQHAIDLRLGEGSDADVLARFRRIDARTFPAHVATLSEREALEPAGYTPGVQLAGARDPMACLTRESRFHTMLEAGGEVVVPPVCPTHHVQTVVETIRHALARTTAHGMAFPALAVSCPACGECRATPLAVPAVCPACGYRPPEYGMLLGNRFVGQPAAVPDDAPLDEPAHDDARDPHGSGVDADDVDDYDMASDDEL